MTKQSKATETVPIDVDNCGAAVASAIVLGATTAVPVLAVTDNPFAKTSPVPAIIAVPIVAVEDSPEGVTVTLVVAVASSFCVDA